MYTFRCDKCGGLFYSKVDQSNWKHHSCNACAGKSFKDYPVPSNAPEAMEYQPRPVPVSKPQYNGVAPQQVKKEFNLDAQIEDLLTFYDALKIACEQRRLTIPENNLCQWATSLIIQRDKVER